MLIIKYILFFPTAFIRNIFRYDRYWASYVRDTRRKLLGLYFKCLLLFSGYNHFWNLSTYLNNISVIKFHENLFSRSRVAVHWYTWQKGVFSGFAMNAAEKRTSVRALKLCRRPKCFSNFNNTPCPGQLSPVLYYAVLKHTTHFFHYLHS